LITSKTNKNAILSRGNESVDKLQYLVPQVKKSRQCTSLQPLGKETNMTIDEEMSEVMNSVANFPGRRIEFKTPYLQY
jgi:hypothetical protein